MTKAKYTYLILMLIALGIFSLGLADGAFGIAWPWMREELGQPLERAGFIIITQGIFYSLGSSQVGRLAKRFHLQQIDFLGACLMAVGLFGMAVSPHFSLSVVATASLSGGAGMVDASLNAYAARRVSPRQLTWLHGFWGAGAMLSPILMTRMIIGASWRVGYLVFALILCGIVALLFLCLWRGAWERAEWKLEALAQAAVKAHYLSKKRYQGIQVVIAFLYGGIKTATILWLPTVLLESRDVYVGLVGMFPAAYFGAFMAGRLVIGSVSNRFQAKTLFRFGLSGVFLGVILFLFSGSIIAIAGAGFALAPVFPSIMRDTKIRFHPDSFTKLVGYELAALGAGSGLLSAFIGQVMAWTTLEMLFPSVLVLIVLAFLLNEVLERRVVAA